MPTPPSLEHAYEPLEPRPEIVSPIGSQTPSPSTDAIAHPAREERRLLHGSLTALATPFWKDDISEKAFADLVAWQIEQGANGLVVCSATGEAATLTRQERDRLVQIAVETAAGRIPIIAATGTNCTRETIAMTQAAEAKGATAVLIVTPYYNKPNQNGLYRHYYEIARSVDLPIIVENDPSRTGIDIRPETLVRLAEIPNIVGVEDATGDLARLTGGSLAMRFDFIRLSGDDKTCLPFRMAGGHGSISIVANVVPKLWVEMQQASRCGDWGRASIIQMRFLPLLSALQLETNPGPIKYALSFLRPWFSPKIRLPLVPVSYETGSAIVAALTVLNLID
jgi:4-hydroxy-tetrahydrodipicolinate synthase